MRAFLAALALTLAAPASAAAAGFGELPLQTVQPGAVCVRATGAPGELVRWTPRGARIVAATAAGLGGSTPVPLGGDVHGCPVAAAQPGGAGVVAALVDDGIGVALREPGGGWAPPVRLRPTGPDAPGDLAVAVSASGAAVVAWSTTSGTGAGRVEVARRDAGGGFGAPVELAHWPAGDGRPGRVLAGVDGAGGAVVAWTRPGRGVRMSADVAIAAPGAPFGTPQRVSDTLEGDPALTVGADGRALLALPDADAMRVAERAPGGTFGPALKLGGDPGTPAVALRSDGAAVVAWVGTSDGTGIAVARMGPGAFGPPLPLGEPGDTGQSGVIGGSGTIGVSVGSDAAGLLPFDSNGAQPRAVFARDGRPVVTWGGNRTRAGFSFAAAQVATLTAGGVFGPSQVLGSPLRDAAAVAPVILPGGAPAVAWSDNAGGVGHLHLAPEGAVAPPQAPFPRVRIGRARKRVLSMFDPLVLPVTCSAACDVRARLAAAGASVSLLRAGRTALRLGGEGAPIVPGRRGGTVRVRVASGPPGATRVQVQTVSVRLRHPRVPPLPRVLDFSAVRNGRAVIVRWRTDRSSRGLEFRVSVSPAASFRSSSGSEQRGSSARTFRSTFELGRDYARYARLEIWFDGARQRRVATVRVR